MIKLDYTFKADLLFKKLFVMYLVLLKKLFSSLLEIRFESIGQFIIINPEMPPVNLGEEFYHLGINMSENGQCIDIEIQILPEIRIRLEGRCKHG